MKNRFSGAISSPGTLGQGIAESPFGVVSLSWNRATLALHGLTFQVPPPPPVPVSSAEPDDVRTAHRLLALVLATLKTRTTPSDLLLAPAGTAFQQEVWQALREIPPGKTITYGQLATSLGRPRGARAVGQAVGANPIALAIPCHRVIGAGGTLGGYAWGLPLKTRLLDWEKSQADAIPD